jgi:alkylhydroperoxidase family enzyme
MTRPRARDEASLDPAARATLARARVELGSVPEPLAALGAAPEALAGAWALVEGAFHKGRVPRTTKELAALAAASRAGAASIGEPLRGALAARGVDGDVLDELAARGDSPRLPDRTRRMIALARRVALEAGAIEDAELNALRRDGLQDAELAELVAVGGTLAALIAIARALGIDAEPRS